MKRPRKELLNQKANLEEKTGVEDQRSESNLESLGSKTSFWQPQNAPYSLPQLAALCKPRCVYKISPHLEASWGHLVDETYIQTINTWPTSKQPNERWNTVSFVYLWVLFFLQSFIQVPALAALWNANYNKRAKDSALADLPLKKIISKFLNLSVSASQNNSNSHQEKVKMFGPQILRSHVWNDRYTRVNSCLHGTPVQGCARAGGGLCIFATDSLYAQQNREGTWIWNKVT